MKKNISHNVKKFLRKFTEYPLCKLEDRVVLNNKNSKIPPNVFQTWETNLFGKTHFNSLKLFRENNPDLSFYLFDKEKRDDYMNSKWQHHPISKIYFNALLGPLQSDIFRYCILFDLGGYYFDISKGCRIPLNQLHENNHEAIITYEDNTFFIPPSSPKHYNLLRPFNYFLQWGLAFAPKHNFLSKLIDEICLISDFYKNKEFENPKLAVLNFTGPGMYTNVMRKYITDNDISSMKELDIKFNDQGIFNLKGSTFRHYQVPSYTYLKNIKICN